MDSSPPTTPDPACAPRRTRLDTIKAQIGALDDLVGLAKLSIRVFDIDLSEMGWSSVARHDALAAFLRASRNARLDIIVHDSRYLEGRCARLQALQRLYGNAINLYASGPEAQGARDPLAIIDGRHYLHRFDIEQPRAILGIEDVSGATPLILRFDEIWATGAPAFPGSLLGL
jgi:hypothetical protein